MRVGIRLAVRPEIRVNPDDPVAFRHAGIELFEDFDGLFRVGVAEDSEGSESIEVLPVRLFGIEEVKLIRPTFGYVP